MDFQICNNAVSAMNVILFMNIASKWKTKERLSE